MPDNSKPYAQELWDYVHAVEDVNVELVNALKQSIRLLEQFSNSVPNPVGWKRMLDDFRNVLEAAVRTNQSKTVH
jgi:hypothetical protein